MDAAAFILDILFPAECVACGVPVARGTLCDGCRIGIAPHRTAFCGACTAPLPALRSICHPRASYLLGAAGDYADPALHTLIRALKFGRVRSAAEPLADLLVHYCARLPLDWRGITVMPVPISRERMRERGFNQSSLIAKHVAHFFGAPFRDDILLRSVHRAPQSEIKDHAERRENIRGCFSLRMPGRSSGIVAKIRKAVLIDDVTTSGATFTEAAKALKAAGVKKILALAVAKA